MAVFSSFSEWLIPCSFPPNIAALVPQSPDCYFQLVLGGPRWLVLPDGPRPPRVRDGLQFGQTLPSVILLPWPAGPGCIVLTCTEGCFSLPDSTAARASTKTSLSTSWDPVVPRGSWPHPWARFGAGFRQTQAETRHLFCRTSRA